MNVRHVDVRRCSNVKQAISIFSTIKRIPESIANVIADDVADGNGEAIQQLLEYIVVVCIRTLWLLFMDRDSSLLDVSQHYQLMTITLSLLVHVHHCAPKSRREPLWSMFRRMTLSMTVSILSDRPLARTPDRL